MRGDKPKAKATVHQLATAARLKPPAPPEHLDEVAAMEWKRLAPELTRENRLLPKYLRQFEIYCQAYSDWRRNQKLVDEEGRLYETLGRNGRLEKKKQALIQRDEAALTMLRVGGLFGLTPRDDAALGSGMQGDFFAALEERLNG